MGKKRLVAAIAAIWAAYMIWPYMTLYRLGEAIRSGDDATLEALVDWDGVREGIKEDVSDTVLEPEAEVASSDAKLPPFGFSFVKGITGNKIDSSVTPQGLVSAAHPTNDEAQRGSVMASARNPTVSWAFFDSPTSFSVLLRAPGLPPEQPIRIELALRSGAWKVVRAWLPPAMLVAGRSRT